MISKSRSNPVNVYQMCTCVMCSMYCLTCASQTMLFRVYFSILFRATISLYSIYFHSVLLIARHIKLLKDIPIPLICNFPPLISSLFRFANKLLFLCVSTIEITCAYKIRSTHTHEKKCTIR